MLSRPQALGLIVLVIAIAGTAWFVSRPSDEAAATAVAQSGGDQSGGDQSGGDQSDGNQPAQAAAVAPAKSKEAAALENIPPSRRHIRKSNVHLLRSLDKPDYHTFGPPKRATPETDEESESESK